MPTTLQENDWQKLLRRISKGSCTPFLGGGVCSEFIPHKSKTAHKWAEEKDYPFEDRSNLARVAQYIAVEDESEPREMLRDMYSKFDGPNLESPNEPHRVLADLQLPVYITTNYDDSMVRALARRKVDPRYEVCRWTDRLSGTKSVFDGSYEPTAANPIVFHLYGRIDDEDSLVLTEYDYLRFLVNVSRDQKPDQKRIPPRIEKAITGSSLLFLGYQLYEWDFRVLFHTVSNYLENSLARAHVAVQVMPMGAGEPDERRARAQRYLDLYFGKFDIRVYWGTCHEFAAELKERWERFNADA